MSHQHRIIEDTVYFWFAANDTSGSGADGASPVYDVRLAGAAAGAIPVLSGSATLLTHANFPAGAHEVEIAATTGNGFAAGNTYGVFCTLLVDSQNPTGFIGSVSLEPIISDLREMGGAAQSATDLKDFADVGYDPATNKVEGVKLTDENTDMVGTDSAALAATALSTAQWTAARAGYLDELNAPNLPADIDTLTARIIGTLAAGTHNAQSGDSFARIGVNGASLSNISLPATGLDLILKDSTFALAMANSVWDEILTAATHNVSTSAGRRLRDIASDIVLTGTSPDTAGTANTAIRIELDGDASADDGAYDPAIIVITGGTGVGQARQIFQYDGTNKYAYINRDWKVVPDNTSVYTIVGNSGNTHVNEGLARGGTNNTITLNTLADANNDTYKGQMVFLFAGTGQDQSGLITSYNGSTQVATINKNWITNPDGNTVYAILPNNDFDHTADTVARVTLVDTTTTNTDMVGTNGANTTVPDAAGVAPTAVEVRQEMDSNSTQLIAIKAKTDNLPSGVKKNVALSNFTFFMVLTSDHTTPATGLTVTGNISINGAAFGTTANSVSEISNGAYKINWTQAEMNGDVITLVFNAPTADQRVYTILTV